MVTSGGTLQRARLRRSCGFTAASRMASAPGSSIAPISATRALPWSAPAPALPDDHRRQGSLSRRLPVPARRRSGHRQGVGTRASARLETRRGSILSIFCMGGSRAGKRRNRSSSEMSSLKRVRRPSRSGRMAGRKATSLTPGCAISRTCRSPWMSTPTSSVRCYPTSPTPGWTAARTKSATRSTSTGTSTSIRRRAAGRD